MHGHDLRVRDARSLPFFWISRTLLSKYKLSWRAILAYTAVAYFAHSETASCRNIGLKRLAQVVGVSQDTMRRGLAEAVEKKAMRSKQRFSKIKNGKRLQLPTEYILVNLRDDPNAESF